MAIDIAVAETAPRSTGRERAGWYFYDWANSAFSTTVVTVFLGPYLIDLAQNAVGEHGRVHVLGIPIVAGSIFSYTVSLSVILQVLILPVVGAIADRSPYKRQLLALFAYIGAVATICFLFATGERWLVGALLFVLANVALGTSSVVYNSFLPQIAEPDERDRVSTIGWGLGYLGGGVLLALNLGVYEAHGALHLSQSDAARYCLASAGVWWAAWTSLPLARLRNRPAVAGEHTRGSVLTDGFRQLGHTLRKMRAYPLTLAFLGAYLIYNDGIQTVITMASVYADKELGLSQGVRIETILLVQFVAFGGALLLGRLARRYGPRNTILASLVLWVVALGFAYYLPHGKTLPFLALGVLIAIVLGGSQSLSRSVFSQLIPHGQEAEYFGIYEIAQDGTTWLGPLLFGLAYQWTGSYRIAIVSLLVFFILGFVALALVPLRRAIVASGNVPPERL